MGKSGEPYNAWRVQQLAKEGAAARASSGKAAMPRCDRVVPFSAGRFPGYTHRRTRGHGYESARGLDDRNVVTGARTYVFKLTAEALASTSSKATAASVSSRKRKKSG